MTTAKLRERNFFTYLKEEEEEESFVVIMRRKSRNWRLLQSCASGERDQKRRGHDSGRCTSRPLRPNRIAAADQQDEDESAPPSGSAQSPKWDPTSQPKRAPSRKATKPTAPQ